MGQNEEWVPREVRIPKGARLASSHETPDAERALLFDESGNNLGPAELRPSQAQTDRGKELAAAIGLAIGTLVTFVVVRGPDVKDGWNAKVLPAVKAKWTSFRSRGADSQAPSTEDQLLDVETSRDASAGPSLTLVHPEADVLPDPDLADPGSATPAA